MKFLFFDDFVPGLLIQDSVFDISSAFRSINRNNPQGIVEDFIANYEMLLPKIKDIVKKGKGLSWIAVRVRQPVPRPVHIICALRNYKGGTGQQNLDFLLKSSTCVIGPGDTIEIPEGKASMYQGEPELGVIIKRRAKGVNAARAMDYVFGYTIFNDVSAKNNDTSNYFGKSYDTFGPMGPVLVTADEIPDPHHLGVKLWVNGDLKCEFNTSEMINRIENLIEILSSVSTLVPGDIISTGTHPKAITTMQHADIVKIEIDGIGDMTQRVINPATRTGFVKT